VYSLKDSPRAWGRLTATPAPLAADLRISNGVSDLFGLVIPELLGAKCILGLMQKKGPIFVLHRTIRTTGA